MSYFSVLGAIWLVVEIYNNATPDQSDIKLSLLLMSGIAFGINLVWYLVDGYLLLGFLRKKVIIASNAFPTKVTVEFGDIFKHPGWKVIGVNDFFDSLVDESHISSESLHGQMLRRSWSGNTLDWDNQITASLGSFTPLEVVSRDPGKGDRYSIGTVADVRCNNDKFLCVALSKTCMQTKLTEATSLDFHISVREILTKAREVCSGEVINFPAIGSGLSRTGIKFNILVNMILLAIFEESKKLDITSEIRIVLPKDKRKEIDLMSLLRSWN